MTSAVSTYEEIDLAVKRERGEVTCAECYRCALFRRLKTWRCFPGCALSNLACGPHTYLQASGLHLYAIKNSPVHSGGLCPHMRDHLPQWYALSASIGPYASLFRHPHLTRASAAAIGTLASGRGVKVSIQIYYHSITAPRYPISSRFYLAHLLTHARGKVLK